VSPAYLRLTQVHQALIIPKRVYLQIVNTCTKKNEDVTLFVLQQGCRDAGMHGCRDAGMQGCRDAGMQGCTDAGMQGCRDAGMQGCTDARMHGCTDARMHGCTDARMHGCTDAVYGEKTEEKGRRGSSLG
jgi:hypothetical protein